MLRLKHPLQCLMVRRWRNNSIFADSSEISRRDDVYTVSTFFYIGFITFCVKKSLIFAEKLQ